MNEKEPFWNKFIKRLNLLILCIVYETGLISSFYSVAFNSFDLLR